MQSRGRTKGRMCALVNTVHNLQRMQGNNNKKKKMKKKKEVNNAKLENDMHCRQHVIKQLNNRIDFLIDALQQDR